MTVAELIIALQDLPQDCDVVSEFGEHWDADVIQRVELCGESDRAYYMSDMNNRASLFVVKLS